MTLTEALRKLKSSRQREFIIFCAAGMDTRDARKHLNVPVPSYYRWLKDPAFKEVLDNLPELSHNYADDALAIIRMRTVVKAHALEEGILAVIQEELKTKKYNLVKTHLGREVFTRAREGKLIQEVAEARQIRLRTWEDKLKELGLSIPKKNKEEKKDD